MTLLDPERCYRALCARDRRFDGVFFVGVETTGIYCRPVCSARTPGKTRCRFFARAAEAEQAGFRACLRCRPERAPGNASVDRPSELARRALGEIGAGALDRMSVDALARRLGVTARHLRRTLEDSVGVSPVALAGSRRLGLAKWLISDTGLSMTDVALTSGFGSIRRFNSAFTASFGVAPSELRRAAPAPRGAEGVSLRLEARAPFAGKPLLEFLRARAVPGVEEITETRYRRFVRFGQRHGFVEAELHESAPAVIARIEAPLLPHLPELVARLRTLFDLDARPDLIDEHLTRDPRLAALVERTPGLRVPGAFDAWELAVRAVLGQQISVKGATTLTSRFVERFGRPEKKVGSLAFPAPSVISSVDPSTVQTIGVPHARARTLVALARAVEDGSVDLSGGSDTRSAVAALTRVEGIGEWTANYVALRALGDPDIFLPGDLVARKALGGVSAKDAEALSSVWRPWRAYALMHLWNAEVK